MKENKQKTNEKAKHSEKIHEMLEGSPICEIIHRLRICGCQESKEEKK